MRLIDADTVKQDIYKYIKEEGRLINPYRMLDYIDSVKTSKKAIPIELYEQIKGERDVAIEQLKALNIELFEKPYLKAIPIEWIKKWCNEEHNRKSLEERLLKRYGVITMLEDWEKENERDV